MLLMVCLRMVARLQQIEMLEYLILNNRLEAALRFGEVAGRGLREELLGHFSRGSRQQFLRLFALLRREEKLEFYLRVYFLIYSIHPALKARPSIPEDEVAAFKEFLDNRGADLAKTNEFLQFYALPFVKKPLEHASFKSLFRKEWVANLSDKLQAFLAEEERRMRQAAGSLGEGQGGKGRSPQFGQEGVRQLQQRNRRLFEQVEAYKAKFSSLERNNQALIESFNTHLMESQSKWFQVTRELTNNARALLEMVARGQSGVVKDRKYQRIRRRTEKFERMIRRELEELLNQSQDLSVFDKPSLHDASHSASFTPNLTQPNLTTYLAIDEFVPTDFVGLMRDLKRGGEELRVRVLQGFSWRIIKSRSKWVRRQSIVGLILNDVLGLMNGDIQLLLATPALLLPLLRLFLYISEDLYGSRVLFRNGALYKEILEVIPQVLAQKQYPCLALILEILENIWHSKEILLELIRLNVIDTCVNLLLEDPQVRASDDLLESVATLLLNATALREGLDAFEGQINIFYSLSEAFKEGSDSNRNLIGAIMYALLGRREMWRLAHEAKLPHFIEDLLAMDFRCNRQQLLLLQEKLQAFQSGNTLEDEYFQDQSIDSDLQEEIFQRNEQELTDLEDYIKGHELLTTKYYLKGKDAEKQLQEINQIMEQFKTKDQPQPQPQPRPSNKSEQQKMQKVRLPELKPKKQEPLVKSKNAQKKQYYSYKSPNFKQDQKNAYSVQVEPQGVKQRIHSFQGQQEEGEKRAQRVQTKPSSKVNESKEEGRVEKRSSEKPQYRIKKSSSVEKGLYAKKPYINYDSKNNSNVEHKQAEYKSIAETKSPPQKRSREQVLKQLNEELRAEKRAVEKERKVSSKHIPANESPVQRENTHLKMHNNFVGGEMQELRAFASKPKIRRTPPKEEDE